MHEYLECVPGKLILPNDSNHRLKQTSTVQSSNNNNNTTTNNNNKTKTENFKGISKLLVDNCCVSSMSNYTNLTISIDSATNNSKTATTSTNFAVHPLQSTCQQAPYSKATGQHSQQSKTNLNTGSQKTSSYHNVAPSSSKSATKLAASKPVALSSKLASPVKFSHSAELQAHHSASTSSSSSSYHNMPPPPPPPPLPQTAPLTQSIGQLPAIPSNCGAKNLSKLKRFLTTLQQFAADISPEIGDRVKHLVLSLVNSGISIEEFHSKLQEATNFPLRPFVIPFLKSNLPLLQYELIYLSRASKLGPNEYLIQNAENIFSNGMNLFHL